MSPPVLDHADLAPWVDEVLVGRSRTLLGVAGPPGSGKSTIATSLAERFDAPIVGMDGFHLALEVVVANGWLDVKGAPHTFDGHGFVALLRRLAEQGADEVVYAPRYDRAARNPIGSAIGITPTERLVIVEGNYLLLESDPWRRVASLLAACVYLDLDAETRVRRLVDRHIAFGKEPDEAEEFVKRSDETNAALVAATRHRADLAIRMT